MFIRCLKCGELFPQDTTIVRTMGTTCCTPAQRESRSSGCGALV